MEIAKTIQKKADPPSKSADDDSSLEIVVALLIALVTVIGAIVIWWASIANDEAGDADFAGLQAALNAQETRTLSYVETYKKYRAFTNYRRQVDLRELIIQEIEGASEEEAKQLADEAQVASNLAYSMETLFDGKFVTEEGTYNLPHQLREEWANAAEQKDLDPEPYFEDANIWRAKTNSLLGMEMLLAMSLIFYTSVELVEKRQQYLMTALGSLLAIAGTIGAVYIHFDLHI